MFTTSAPIARIKLVRNGRVFATGEPALDGANATLRFAADRRLRAGMYQIVVRERLEDGSIRVTRTPVLVGKQS